MRRVFPAKSPTVGLIWASAIFIGRLAVAGCWLLVERQRASDDPFAAHGRAENEQLFSVYCREDGIHSGLVFNCQPATSNPQLPLGAGAGEDYADGAGEDLHVQPETPILDVGSVEGDVAVEGGVLPRLNLPEASHAGEDVEAAKVGDVILLDLGGHGRAWANQAHVSAKNVVELGQFVEGVFAQEAPDSGDAGIVGDFEQNAVALVPVQKVLFQLVRIDAHGAELVASEGAALAPHTLRAIEDRAVRVELHSRDQEEHERPSEQHGEDGACGVKRALEQEGTDGEVAPVQRDGGKLADVLDWRVPGEAVVEVGDNAYIDAEAPRFFDQGDDQFFLCRDGKEYLVDEQGAGEREAVANVSNDVGVAGFGLVFGKGDEAFEAKPKVAEGFEMIAQCVGDAAGADDEDVAGLQAFAIPAVDNLAPNGTSDAE